MIRKTTYCCQFCDKVFATETEARAHEAEHYFLTPEEYSRWELLTKQARVAGYQVGLAKCRATEAAFDRPIVALSKFEIEHHLSGKDIPIDW